MKLHIDGDLYLVADASSGKLCAMRRKNGGPPMPVTLSEDAMLIARETMRGARVIHLTGELERLKPGELYTAEATGHDTAVIKLPGGGYGLHADGDQQPDIKTASDAARLAYGLPSSLSDRITSTLHTHPPTNPQVTP